MKTSMQELIEEMEYCYKDHNIFLKSTIEKAKKLLEKEKEQIGKAFISGKVNGYEHFHQGTEFNMTTEEYYNQTYNQEETLEEWKSKFTYHCAIKTNQNK